MGAGIALVLHPRRDPGSVLDAVGAWASSHGSRLLMRAGDAARWDGGDVAVVSEAELAEQADAVVSLGGDGTMLGALRLVARRPVPVLGVNLGNLGFLVEVQPEELHDALDRLERLDFTIEQHSALWLGADGDEAVAFNDLALVRVPGDGVVEAVLTVGGQRMGRYRCDGLVISTSIGSTAYAYSAGGPVVSPALDAVVVAPLAPLAGHQPPDGHRRPPSRSGSTLQAGQRAPGDRGRRHDAAPDGAGRGARRAAAGPAAARWCGSTATATSAATRSSSACSTCRSCPRSCASSPRRARSPVARPARVLEPVSLRGQRVRLVPVDPEHAAELFAAGHDGGDPALWEYLPYGPFSGVEEMRLWLSAPARQSEDPLFYAIVDQGDCGRRFRHVLLHADGPAEEGVIEIGHIWFCSGAPAHPGQATEAIFLLARHAFDDLGYRRFEWKCNDAQRPVAPGRPSLRLHP